MLVLNTSPSHRCLEVQGIPVALCHEGQCRSQWFGASHENCRNMFSEAAEHLVGFKAKLFEFLIKLIISVGKADLLGNFQSQNGSNRSTCSPSPCHEDMGFLQAGPSGPQENQVPDTPVRLVMNYFWRNKEEKLLGTVKENGKLVLFFWWQDMKRWKKTAVFTECWQIADY